jgi:hypothetical protein
MHDIENLIIDKLFLEELAQKADLSTDEWKMFYFVLEGNTHVEYSKKENITQYYSLKICRSMISKLKGIPITEDEPLTGDYDLEAIIMELWTKGFDSNQIGEILGLSPSFVLRFHPTKVTGIEHDTNLAQHLNHLGLNKIISIPCHCCICGKKLNEFDGVCHKCYKEYCPDGVIPEWLKFLIKSEMHERYDTRKTAMACFTDLDLNFEGEKEYEDNYN